MKGIAARHLVLLILAMITLAVIAYLVYRYFTGSTISEQECKAVISAACNSCKFCVNTSFSITRTRCSWDGGCSDMASCAPNCGDGIGGGPCSIPSKCNAYLSKIGISAICPDDCKKLGVE